LKTENKDENVSNNLQIKKKIDTHFVSVGKTNLEYEELQFSMIHRLRSDLLIKLNGNLEIRNIQEHK